MCYIYIEIYMGVCHIGSLCFINKSGRGSDGPARRPPQQPQPRHPAPHPTILAQTVPVTARSRPPCPWKWFWSFRTQILLRLVRHLCFHRRIFDVFFPRIFTMFFFASDTWFFWHDENRQNKERKFGSCEPSEPGGGREAAERYRNWSPKCVFYRGKTAR